MLKVDILGMHYYGDVVRKLFLAGAVFMLVTLPYVTQYLSEPIYLSLFAILVLAVISGFISPMQKFVNIGNAFVSAIAFLVFEYYAVQFYTDYSFGTLFFINQTLALNFIVALYFSSKTIRGTFLE